MGRGVFRGSMDRIGFFESYFKCSRELSFWLGGVRRLGFFLW